MYYKQTKNNDHGYHCGTVNVCSVQGLVTMKRCHTELVVLRQVHIPLSVVGIGDLIYIIPCVVDTAHPQMRILLTNRGEGLVLPVVLVWIQLQCDTINLVPVENLRYSCPMSCGSLGPEVIGPRQSWSLHTPGSVSVCVLLQCRRASFC